MERNGCRAFWRYNLYGTNVMEMRGCAAARKVLYETGRTAVYCIRTSTCVQYVYRTAVYSNTVHTTYICMLTLYRMI